MHVIAVFDWWEGLMPGWWESSGFRARQICVESVSAIFTSLWPQSLMWVRWDISPWRPVNIHYLCFVIFMIATPHGCSHLLLLLTAQCVHGLEHWLCSKRAIWSLALFLMSDPCFCQMLGDRRNNHPFSVINVYCWIYCMHCIPNLTNEPNRW